MAADLCLLEGSNAKGGKGLFFRAFAKIKLAWIEMLMEFASAFVLYRHF